MFRALNIPVVLLATGLVLSSGCASTESREVHRVQKEWKNGNYASVYAASKKALEEKSKYTPEQAAELEKLFAAADGKLRDHYSTMLSSQLMLGEVDTALETYQEVANSYEGLNRDMLLQRRLMRAYARKGSFELAKAAAETVVSNATEETDRADAQEFLANLDKFQLASARADDYYSQISSSSPANEEGEATVMYPACIKKEQLDIPEESKVLLEQFNTALLDREEAFSKLGDPRAVQ